MVYECHLRQEDGFCGIQWSPTQGLAATLENFELSDTAIASVANSEEAYVGIPGSMNDIYSGKIFAPLPTAIQSSDAAILASGRRFVLEFYSKTGTQVSKGYDLTWMQAPCSGSSVPQA